MGSDSGRMPSCRFRKPLPYTTKPIRDDHEVMKKEDIHSMTKEEVYWAHKREMDEERKRINDRWIARILGVVFLAICAWGFASALT